MNSIQTFDEARVALDKFCLKPLPVSAAYSLERMTQLMDYLGNPQNKLKIIHVAGTSGKTSTCYFVASMLIATGSKVGMTISPHLDEINERLQINLLPLPEPQYCQVLKDFLEIISACNVRPTYFELLVALAYWHFAEQQVDYAVIEVGLGGLLDSTNVCDRQDKACVITDIGMDHQLILGHSLAEIAAQKAGIIGHGNHVFCYRQAAEVDVVIQDTCRHKGAQLHALNPHAYAFINSAVPEFQQRNWQLAADVFNYIQKRDALPELSANNWDLSRLLQVPGRLEVVQFQGKTLVMDAAHNPQKMAALVTALKGRWPGKKFSALVAFKETKDADSCLTILESVVSNTLVTKVQSHNTVDIQLAFTDFIKQSDSLLLVTGSIYLLSEIRKLLSNS